jgi:hypothetical protein
LKFASGNSAATREGRAEQLRRNRAGAQAMRAAFPSVRQLRIGLKFGGAHPNMPAAQLHEIYPPARAFFFYPCPYAGCDGCFDLSAAVKTAIDGELHVTEGLMVCSGSRPRDYASRQECQLNLHYEIRAFAEDAARPKARGRLPKADAAP